MGMMMTIVLEKDSKLQVNKFSDSDDDDSLNESHQLQGKREAERRRPSLVESTSSSDRPSSQRGIPVQKGDDCEALSYYELIRIQPLVETKSFFQKSPNQPPPSSAKKSTSFLFVACQKPKRSKSNH